MYGIPRDPSRPKQPVEEKEFAPGLRIMAPAREAQARRKIENEALAGVAQGTVQRSADQAVAGALQVGAQRNRQVPVSPLAKGDNPERAAQLQALQSQPAVKGPERPDGFGVGLAQTAKGLHETVQAGIEYPVDLAIDGVRNWVGKQSDGDVTQIHQFSDDSGKRLDRGQARLDQGASTMGEGVKAAGRAALGIDKAAPAVASQAPAATPTPPSKPQATAAQPDPTTANPAPAAGAPAAPVTDKPAADSNGYMKTGFGAGAQGGEIVVRQGVGGVPEFTNDKAAQAGAGSFVPMQAQGGVPGRREAPAGSTVLASGSNADTPEQELARQGSVANLGNGKGTFSVMGQDGDARLAMERYARANEIRAGIPRQRELGDNGGKLTVVRDSSRAPSTTERVNAKLEAGQAQTAALQARVAQGQQEQDRADLTAATDRQLKAMESAQAGLALADRQRLSELQQAILDPSLSTEDRRLLADQYRVLSGNKAENRFTVVPGGQAINEQGVAYTLPSTVINNQTGEFVQQGDSGSGGGSGALPMPASAAEAKVGAVYETAKGPARWDGKQFIPVVS